MSQASASSRPTDVTGGVGRRRTAALLFTIVGGAITIWAASLVLGSGFDRPLVGVALGLALVAANLAPVVAVSGGRIDAFTPVGALLVPIGLLMPLPEAIVVYALGEGIGVLAAHRFDRHVGGPEADAAPRTSFVIGKSIVGAALGLVALQQVADSGSPVPTQILAALVGVGVSTAFDHTAVATVSWLVGGRPFWEEMGRGMAHLSVVAGGEVLAGALIAVLAGRDPWSLLLGLAMFGLLLVAGSAYARAAADRRDTQELLRLAEELQEAMAPEQVERALLASVQRLLPLDPVEISDSPPGPEHRGWRLSTDGERERWLRTPRIVDTRDYEQQPMAIVGAAASLARVAMTRAAAQDVLAEQDRLRRLILSTVAHDIRSPLAIASGGLEMLTDTEGAGRLDLEQRTRLLSASARAVGRIQRLIDDLIGLERSGGAGGGHAAVDVAAAVRSLVPEVEVGDVAVELELSEGLVAAIDEVSFERVVENLLRNAVRYSPPGQPVTVRTSRADDGVLVTVADQGPGVAREDRHVIFEPFRQGAGERGGVGLGLYVTRRFVENHEGRIWVEEVPGGGAAFRVWLPAARG